MMPGDIPCEKPCHNTHCRHCMFGTCTDNAPCGDQTDEDGNLTHDKQYKEEAPCL